jgi:creatinine amidohydrolase
MGSDPYLAQADHGARFLDLAAASLVEDLRDFLADAPAV